MEVLFPRRPRYRALNVRAAFGAVLVAAACACNCVAQDSAADNPAPYFDARSRTPEYFGPVDQRAVAADLPEIRIGYFGPSDPRNPLYGNLWRAAQRAIDDANRRGGFEGKPYRLVPAWSDNPWGSGVTQVTRLVYRDRVWAIVGGVDGPTTHLAEQVVVKARLALVSPVSTDKTVNLTNVPWMFSLAPGDHLVADVLTSEIARRARAGNFILVTTNDHDAFLLTRELRRAMTASHIAPSYQFEYQPQSRAIESLVHECLAATPANMIIIANPTDSLHLVRAMRHAGFAGCILGGPAMGRDIFVRQIAESAGKLVFPLLNDTARTPVSTTDAADHAPAFSPAGIDTEEDYAALHVYDAVSLVTSAIEKAGLNRAAIARAIRELSPIAGTSGRIEWDGPGSNVRRPTLATIVEGRVVPLSDTCSSLYRGPSVLRDWSVNALLRSIVGGPLSPVPAG
jgi:branched-chain amino acid transport system substrate-binding protein